MRDRSPLVAAAVVLAALAALPVAAVLVQRASPPATGAHVWAHLAATVLPGFVANTLAARRAGGRRRRVRRHRDRVAGDGLPVSRRARCFEWALMLPLAMPAYVMAYAYTDWLQFAGPVQTSLRALTGWRAREYWFPEIRSLAAAPRAAVVRVVSLRLSAGAHGVPRQPRAAPSKPARLAGLGAWGSFWRVALPLARPAIAAGTALALMETLADFGTVSYFARADIHHRHLPRLAVDGRPASPPAQLSRLPARVRGAGARAGAREPRPRALCGAAAQAARRSASRARRAALAFAACAMPVLLGFLLPGRLAAAPGVVRPRVPSRISARAC